MAYCSNCGAEVNNSNYCQECGNEISQPSIRSDYKDTGGFWYLLLGACIPLVGIILFFTMKDKQPNRAKFSIIGALIALPLIIIFGIISAFTIPATGQIIENTQKDSVLADALAIESAARLKCVEMSCDDGQEFTWNDLSMYTQGIDETYYDFTHDNGVIVRYISGEMFVYLEANGTGEWELIPGSIPSNSDRTDVIEDND